MKRIIFIFFILVSIFTLGCSAEATNEVEDTQVNCPFGNIDCEYPGDCGRYLDTDNNELCDHSKIVQTYGKKL